MKAIVARKEALIARAENARLRRKEVRRVVVGTSTQIRQPRLAIALLTCIDYLLYYLLHHK